MLDLRRKNINVRVERREHPRIDFHCPVAIRGIEEICRIVDLSVGGAFVEINSTEELKVNQIVELTAKFPTEEVATRLKARIISTCKKGIGCQFENIDSRQSRILERCFAVFRHMIPLS